LARPRKNNISFFSHYCNAGGNDKFTALHMHYPGEKGYAMEARFWRLNGLIGDAEGCRLDLNPDFKRPSVAKTLELSLPDFNEFITFLSDPKACDLIHNDDGVIWTDKTQEDLEELNKKRNRDRGDYQGKKAKPSNSDSGNPDYDSGNDTETPVSDNGNDVSDSGNGGFRSKDLTPLHSTALDSTSQSSSEQSPSTSPEPAAGPTPPAPPADSAVKPSPSEPVFSPASLRKQLSEAGVTLDKSQLQEVFQELPHNPFEARACLAYMLRKMKEADKAAKPEGIRKPVPYFLKVCTLWIAEWTRDKPAPEPEKSKGNISALPPEFEEAKTARDSTTPEEMQALTLAAAKLARAHHVQLSEYQARAMYDAGEELTDRELQLLGLPPRVASPAPLFEKEDDFEDDLPYPPEEKAEEEEVIF
jgi:hypothetical protein